MAEPTASELSTVADCRLLWFPKIHDPRGNLTFVEGQRHIPFEIRRAYWIHGVPAGEKRGEHAFRENEEVLIALSGSFEVRLDDGSRSHTQLLNRGYLGLYVPTMIWRELEAFSTNAVCLVLASRPYSVDDYVRDKSEFVAARGAT